MPGSTSLRFVCCLGICLFASAAFAQNSVNLTDTSKEFAGVESDFYNRIGPQSRLYNGTKFEFYDHKIGGSAFYGDATAWNTGSVIYDGYLYTNVQMMYDIYADQLIILLYHNDILMMSLDNNRIESFDLLGHHFINLHNDPSIPRMPKSGFYDALYLGKIHLLVRREKSEQQKSDLSNTIESYFTAATADYFLYKKGIYYSVNSKGEFLNQFKDHKKEIQRFISDNKLKFKKAVREAAMQKIAAYYDQLTN